MAIQTTRPLPSAIIPQNGATSNLSTLPQEVALRIFTEIYQNSSYSNFNMATLNFIYQTNNPELWNDPEFWKNVTIIKLNTETIFNFFDFCSKSFSPPLDVIITDERFPKIIFFELLKAVNEIPAIKERGGDINLFKSVEKGLAALVARGKVEQITKLLSIRERFLSMKLDKVKCDSYYPTLCTENKNIGMAFHFVAHVGCFEIMKLIMQHPDFDYEEIFKTNQEAFRIAAQEYGIGKTFVEAASRNHVTAMEYILTCPEFQIPADGEYGLGTAFIKAASKGHFKAMEFILKRPEFGEDGIVRAFFETVSQQDLTAMQNVLKYLPKTV